jgi:hypothetical protein
MRACRDESGSSRDQFRAFADLYGLLRIRHLFGQAVGQLFRLNSHDCDRFQVLPLSESAFIGSLLGRVCHGRLFLGYTFCTKV